MTSPPSCDNLMQNQTKGPLFNSNETMVSYTCATPNNTSFLIGNNNGSINCSNDPSNLIALNMINQAINFSLMQTGEQLTIPSLQLPDGQKLADTKIMPSGPSPQTTSSPSNLFLASKYQKIRQMIDKSGMLSPNENLVTQNRGECYWADCFFQNEIEDNFKKHLNERHQLTVSTLTQVELSFEKIVHMSKMLLQEQNHLYNMLLHLDQKIKCLSNEPSPTAVQDSSSNNLISLLSKFRQAPNIFEFLNDSAVSSDVSSFGGNHTQFPIHNNGTACQNGQQFTAQQQVNPLTTQQFLEGLSSLLRQQQHSQSSISQQTHNPTSHMNSFPQQQPPSLSSQPVSATSTVNNTPFIGTILPVSYGSVCSSAHSSSNATNGGGLLHVSTNHSVSPDVNNIKLPQSRSSESSYTRSDSESIGNVKESTPKSVKKRTNNQMNFFPKGISDREYYRRYPVRPSASYVNLIKTAIQESPRRELSLNEIYVWMQTEFAYFRDKEQKWKNAIRHNLSLHKCFQRKHGKLWTFNEKEYNLKKSRNRFQYNVPIPGSQNQSGDNNDLENSEEVLDSQFIVKKELEYIDENLPEIKPPDTDEWSSYLQKNSLIIASAVDGSRTEFTTDQSVCH